MPASSLAELRALSRLVREYPGVTRKRRLGALTARMPVAQGFGVVAAFGEDCAVIRQPHVKDEFLLLGLDAIVPDLILKSPRFAGYSSVLVNVLDVAAMGGAPMAVVDFLGSVGPRFERQVADGMAEASRHFDVPIVGGHLHPDDRSPSLAVAILGRVKKRECTFSHTARPGDALLVAADLSGKRVKGYPMAWSPLRHKSRAAVQRRLAAVREAARRGLVGACKDASNPGIIGTFGMMLEASGVGGTIEVDRIPRPPGVALEDWVRMYQGCGFVLAARPARVRALERLMAAHGLACRVVGEATESRTLELARGEARARVFSLSGAGVTGIPPAK